MTDATVHWLNRLSESAAVEELRKCCGSDTWATRMAAERPFADAAAMLAAVEQCFDRLTRDDWLACFNSHPRIGDLNSLRMRLAGNKQWSSGEQAGMNAADETTIARLAAGNTLYDERFGYPFIVCAAGKSALEMCDMLYQRLCNCDDVELTIAGDEQRKITRLRLAKLQPPDGPEH